MKPQFGLIQRPWGVFYLKNKLTGEQTTLKTRDRAEAQRLLQAYNDAESQPHLNHALGMEWLLKSVIPRLLWPRPVFQQKRAITAAERCAIAAREPNPERRDFYELLWHTGASQTDAACLTAEDIDWDQHTLADPADGPCRWRALPLVEKHG